jgi:hypothetical protein
MFEFLYLMHSFKSDIINKDTFSIILLKIDFIRPGQSDLSLKLCLEKLLRVVVKGINVKDGSEITC